MKDRIRQLMEAQHMNQQTFATFTGIGTASLSSIFTGRTRPTLNHVDAILEKFPNVNPLWLLKGQGGMLLTSDGQQSADGDAANATVNADSNSTSNSQNATPAGTAKMSVEPNLFSTQSPPVTQPASLSNYAHKNATSFQFEAEKKTIVQQRKITEIRVFYDDQTWESFVPKKEK